MLTTPQAAIVTLTPFAQEKLIPAGIDTLGIFQRNDLTPANITYWVVSRAGTDGLRILDSQFNTKKTVNFGLTIGAAAMSPDGRTFALVAGGNLRVYDTTTENEISFNFIDVGPTATDALITPDSRRLYVFSVSAQRITAIDLATRQSLGTLSTPLANSGSLTMGANGMIYSAYENNVVEIDPTVPLGADAVRRRLTIAGRAGKVLTTPDGRRLLVTNVAPTAGPTGSSPLLNYFNIADGQNSLTPNPTELAGGPFFDQIVVAGNNVAFATATTTPRKLYRIVLPNISETTGLLDPPGIQEAFFSGKGNLETAQYLSASGEYPVSQRLYAAARLSALSSLVPDTIFHLDVPRNTFIGQLNMPFAVGPNQVLRVPRTSNNTTPTTILSLGTFQPTIPLRGRSRPIGVRVLDGDGLPVANTPVTFLASLAGMTFEGADAVGNVLTNLDGYAYVVAIAPNVAGVSTVTVSSPGIGAANSFVLNVGTGGPGGGGGGGGGGTAAALTIVSGNGQAQSEGASMRLPLVVKVTDSQGNPVAGVPITWTAQGPGRPRLGESTGTQLDIERITKTDDKGLASQELFANLQVGLRQGYSNIILTAATPAASPVEFNAISYQQVTPDGSPVPRPSAILEAPASSREITGRAGELITGAIQARFTASGLALGQPIQKLGIEIFPVDGDPSNGPTGRCDPDGYALSDIGGLASCNLRLGGIVGTGRIRAVLAGSLGEIILTLTVLPGLPSQIAKVSGDNQSGLPGATLPNQLVVRVTDAQGTPLSGQTVTWRVTAGSATVLSSQSVTSAAGQAAVGVILGSITGPVQITATVQGGNNPSTVFVATVNALVASLTKVAGDNQVATAGAQFTNPLVVQVLDNQGRPVAGTPVTFAVATGPVSFLGSAIVNTDANGQASIRVQTSSPGEAIVRASTGNFSTNFNLSVRPIEIFNLSDIRNLNTNAPGTNPTNSASNPGGLTPGGLYRIYARGVGQGITNGVRTANVLFGPLPLRLNGVTVQIGTIFAPIYQVENLNGVEAVVIQAPFELTPGLSDTVTIRINENPNSVTNVPIVPLQPGLFETTDDQNRRYVVAQRPDGRYVTVNEPARLGEQIRVYFTGGGRLLTTIPNTGVATGGVAYTGEVVVGVNGIGARVISARYTPGYVGVYDVLVEIPSTLGPGDNPNGLATGPDRPFAIALRAPGGQTVTTAGQIPIGR